ncbi:hypothetical protein BK648_04800 [Pseudomonas poae]|uniref:YncE family protein n=1 Tax=Pseudomonas poae TaxID=200451 RepID=A0A423FJ67_9PSED|nr:hypothetical protein [Pseudomonas poae]ROM58082.1 hypothetical protein BK648_04800 [Pseudomonas poae]
MKRTVNPTQQQNDGVEPEGIIGVVHLTDTPSRLLVNVDGTRLYVASTNGESVTIIDTASNAIIHTVEGHGAPLCMVLHPTRPWLYISYANRPGNPVIMVISTTTFDVLDTLSGFISINGIAINSSGLRLYAPDSAGELDIIEISNPQQRVKLRFDAAPDIVTIAPGNARAHLANGFASWFTVHLGTNRLVSTVNTQVPSQPSTIAHATYIARVYILYPDANQIYIGDTTTDRQSRILSNLLQPWDITFNSMRGLAYVTETQGHRVSILDTTSESVIGTFEGFNRPMGISSTSDGRMAYVANSGDNTIARVRL